MGDNQGQHGSASNGDRAFVAAIREALIRADIAGTLAAATPADQLLDRLVRIAGLAIPAAAGSLLLVDPGAKVLTFAVAFGQTATNVAALTVPLGRGIAGLVAVSGQPLAIANAQQDPRHARDIAEQIGYLPTTILAVPVTAADGEILGVLELLDRREAETFSLGDIELLGRFAELCAIALEHQRVEGLQTALISRALGGLADLPDDTRAALERRIAALAAEVTADPVARRARELAERVAAIAARGDAEQRACEAIIAVFADYIESHPTPGAGIAAFGLDEFFPKGRS
jgi:GAF domain-containing protein